MTSLQSVWWNLIISRPLLIYLIPRYDSNKKKKKNHQQRDKLCCAGTKAPSHINTQSLPLVSCLCSCFSFISLLKGTQEGWGREEEETSCSCTLRYSLPRSSVLLVVFVSDNDSDDGGDDASDNWGGSCGVKGNFKNPSELFFYVWKAGGGLNVLNDWPPGRRGFPTLVGSWSDHQIAIYWWSITHTHTHTYTGEKLNNVLQVVWNKTYGP